MMYLFLLQPYIPNLAILGGRDTLETDVTYPTLDNVLFTLHTYRDTKYTLASVIYKVEILYRKMEYL